MVAWVETDGHHCSNVLGVEDGRHYQKRMMDTWSFTTSSDSVHSNPVGVARTDKGTLTDVYVLSHPETLNVHFRHPPEELLVRRPVNPK